MASDPRLALLLSRIERWNQAHPGTGQDIDPRAATAVARQEGLSGGIGDGGHAFGPFQLNNAGGVITGKFPGWTPERINQWAWSPQGIDHALGGIAGVAGGHTGAQAVNSIVSRFERPADPQGEIARALAAYGSTQAAPMSGGAPAAPSSPPGGAARTFTPGQISALLSARQAVGLGAPPPSIAAMLTASATSDTPVSLASPAGATRTVAPQAGTLDSFLGRFGLADAITSGRRSPDYNRRVGGSPTSLHLSDRARDINPSDPDFPKLTSFIRSHPSAVSEFFYDPNGWFVKQGKIYKGSIGGHSDHAHIGR